ncbi:MAG TPA: SBBP repeat-containing protein [Pyrinomonadaceae bacterium]|nr:SBBP repeat-containing protein [Pyrinomonadaceae bacterium]
MFCRSENRAVAKQSLSLALVLAIWANFVCLSSYAQALPGVTPKTIGQSNSSLTVQPAERPVASDSETKLDPARGVELSEAYGKLPLRFEVNQGQTDSQARFLIRGRGYSLFLTPTESVMVLRRSSVAKRQVKRTQIEEPLPTPNSATSVVRTKLIGASTEPDINGLEELPGHSNYLIGNDPSKWRVGVPSYARVKYTEIYPGIDLVYYGNDGRLEQDFVVGPGSEPGAIKLGFEGVRRLRIDGNGDLVLAVPGGELRQSKPIAYQLVQGRKQDVASRYRLLRRNQVGFQVGAYDPTLPLVIDPILVYSTYLGGNGEDISNGIALDSSSNAYVTGYTASTNFPTLNPRQAVKSAGNDTFVTKLNAGGNALVYSTYLGGSGDDQAKAIAVDSSGNAYVTGFTSSTNFPIQGTLRPTYGGAPFDAFVFKLNASGSTLAYSAYVGGSLEDQAHGIAVDSSGNAYITGYTRSTNFPTVTPFQATNAGGAFDAFVTKVNAAGTAFSYSTYIGGDSGDRGNAIAVDASGSAYITGSTPSVTFPTVNAFQPSNSGPEQFGNSSDAFITKFSPSGTSLVYSTYLGGNIPNPGGFYFASDSGLAIALDSSGNAYVSGSTGAQDFPTANAFQSFHPAYDHCAFVTKLSSSGSSLVYSTYLGGNSYGDANGIAVDAAGQATVVGYTLAPNFPVVNPLQANLRTDPGGGQDAIITKFSSSGNSLIYSTYLGGFNGDEANAVALDASGNAYVTGYTYAADFPTSGPYQPAIATGPDAFILKIADVPGFSISGHIATAAGQNLAGATVNLTGTQSSTAITNSSGNYTFTNLASGGTFTVTPSFAPYTFLPPSQTFINLSANQTADFVVETYTITGRVTDSGGNGVPGVTMTVSGSASATGTTNANGDYTFINFAQGSNVTVTPSKSDILLTYTFTPPSRSYANMSSNQVGDFTSITSIQNTLLPVADSYVRDGTFAGTNFGTATSLRVQTGTKQNQGNNSDAYFKFDLSGIGQNISSAKLRVSASLSAAGSLSSSVFSVANTSWIESGTGSITWNNRPPRGGTPLPNASMAVASTTLTTFDIDVTNYVRDEKSAGRDLVSLALHNPSTSTIFINVNSREAAANKPQLIISANSGTNNSPTVTLTSPSNGATFGAPASINLSANATDDGSITRVDFYAGTSLIGTSTTPVGSVYSFNWTNVAAGNYNLSAVAIDNSGLASTSNTASVTVGAQNTPPSVDVTAPLNGNTFSAGTNIAIKATASDVDGTISKVDFYAGANLIGTATVPVNGLYSIVWANVNTGAYALTAKATDNANGLTTSAIVNISVVAQAGLSPTADAYVRDGSTAATNFGTATTLQTQSSATAGNNRQSYLKFDTTTITGINKATVRLYGSLSDATGTNVPAGIYSVATTTWVESGSASITWNNKPPTGASPLSTTVITDNLPRWYEFDVTAYLQAEKLAGRHVVSLAVKNTANSSQFASFNSKEATSNQPQLILWSTQPRNVLLVVGSATLNTGDSAVRTRLQNLGYTVTVKVAGSNQNASVKPTDADGKALVLISSTVVAGNVVNKLRNIPVPVVNWEFDILDDMGMTGLVSGTDFGTSSTTQTQLNIAEPTHPMAAGLSGTQTVATTATNFTWGKPNTNAARIAALTNDATRFAIFGYDSGVAMSGLEAPSRRVAVFLTETTAASFNSNGGALFDAAVKWATEVITTPTINTLTPATGPVATVVTVSGLNFGATQGASTLTFNALAATPTTWSDKIIVVAVPASALTGPVVVTVNGIASNSKIFTVAFVDSDSDGLPDSWELQYFGDLSQGANGDPDGDGVTNLQEYEQGRNPTKSALADDDDFVNLKVHTPLEPQP